MDDDFNTPQAFAVLFDFVKNLNQFMDKDSISKKQSTDINKFFQEINKIFGIIDFKKVNKAIPAEIKKLVKDREQHRKDKNWQKSDELRHEIEKNGYLVEDTDKGTIVKSTF